MRSETDRRSPRTRTDPHGEGVAEPVSCPPARPAAPEEKGCADEAGPQGGARAPGSRESGVAGGLALHPGDSRANSNDRYPSSSYLPVRIARRIRSSLRAVTVLS